MNPMGRGKLMTPPVQIIGIQVNKILDVWKGHNFGDRDNPPRNPSSKKLYMRQSVMRYNGTPVIFKAASKASPDDNGKHQECSNPGSSRGIVQRRRLTRERQ